jgi:5-methylcytosine-specific restriction endonuclease McrA
LRLTLKAAAAAKGTSTRRPNEFSHTTQKEALARQKNRCASCGTPISALGQAGKADHKYGEGVQAHHVEHVKLGGSDSVDNCVVICQACHYSVHEGGRYRKGTVVGQKSDFPYFNG